MGTISSREPPKIFVVHCCSGAKSRLTLWDPMDYSNPGFLALHYLLKFAQTHVHWVSDAIQPSHPLVSPFSSRPQSFPTSVFSNVSALHIRWPKYWSFSVSPSNEYSGLISFRMDWFDLLAVQGTLKSLLQHHSLKTSIKKKKRKKKTSVLPCSAFFTVQLSHPYMTTGRTIALTIWTFVSKMMSLLFNMLSSFVISFLPRSNHLLISWLQSPSSVILEPKKIKSATVSIFFHLFVRKW